MNLSPDDVIVWKYGCFNFNETILATWALLFFLVLTTRFIARRLSSDIIISKWQSFLEIIVLGVKNQIEEIGARNPEKYVSFLGTLFVFLATANLFGVIPGYSSPTSSLSTTAALAIVVFISVIVFGIREKGIQEYLLDYCKPAAVMLPFNIIGEFSRTISLAVRLFGNMMSGELIVSILLAIVPFFVPMIMNIFGLFIGMVQAYVFTILSMVYIAAATQKEKKGA